MYTLYTDVYYSRRLRMHHVCDESDDPLWSGTEIVEALDFLVERDIKTIRIEGGPPDLAYLIDFRRA